LELGGLKRYLILPLRRRRSGGGRFQTRPGEKLAKKK
jgi:hypothetical protein